MQKGRDGSNPRLKVMGPRGGPGKVRRVGGCDRMKRNKDKGFCFCCFYSSYRDTTTAVDFGILLILVMQPTTDLDDTWYMHKG